MKNIRVVSANIKGLRNLQNNVSCQDHCHHSIGGKNFVAIVSDGAGSAKYGKIGARIACETIVDLLKNVSFGNIKKEVYRAVEIAREKIFYHRLNKRNEDISKFAATIVGLVYHKKYGGIFFHIGDGAGICFVDNKYDNFVISKPENGDFSCETYFYTMNNWKSSLRITSFEKKHNTFILMSDGLTNFSFSNDFTKIEENFLFPINEFLSQELVKSKAMRALTKTLSNPKAAIINPDDKTFLWAKVN